jgi:KDO2-lipid IV(A) lauroyltransferase
MPDVSYLLKIIAALPLPLLHALGKMLGMAGILIRPRTRKTLGDNLRRAGLYSHARFLASAGELGKNILETLPIWLNEPTRNLDWIRAVHGWEAVEAARAQGRGIVFLTPHLGCWELTAQYIAARMPLAVLYRPPRQAWAEGLMRHGRQKGQARLATPDLRGVRALLSALKRGEAAGILPDQVASKGDGVWVHFFGHPAYMPTLTQRLLQASHAACFLCFGERLPWGRGFRLWLEAVDALPEDPVAATQALNRQIEALIRRRPEQYLWSYPIYRRRRRMGVPPGNAAQGS